jgi:hypothetical protein
MDWGRLVTDDANETDLLRSYVVRVTDATFGYEAEQAAAESGVPAADGRERMWMLFERGALRLVGSITDDDRIGVEPCDSTTSGMSRRRRTGRWSNGGVRWQQRPTKPTIKAPRFDIAAPLNGPLTVPMACCALAAASQAPRRRRPQPPGAKQPRDPGDWASNVRRGLDPRVPPVPSISGQG